MRQLSKNETVRFALGIASLAGIILLQALPAEAARRLDAPISIMKRDAVAISGRCQLNGVSSQAEASELLGYYNIRMNGSRPEERIALANGLFQASALHGGVFSPMANTRFDFACRRGPSRQTASGIQMNRCSGRKSRGQSSNAPHLLHEIGHKVGNSSMGRGRTFYSAYSAAVRGTCRLTNYAKKKRNEQFGEAFAAYLTRPELLSNGSAECRRAYAFFADQVFRQNGRLASCDQNKKQELMARLRSNQVLANLGGGRSGRAPAEQRVASIAVR